MECNLLQKAVILPTHQGCTMKMKQIVKDWEEGFPKGKRLAPRQKSSEEGSYAIQFLVICGYGVLNRRINKFLANLQNL
jgi:hypothetical protein